MKITCLTCNRITTLYENDTTIIDQCFHCSTRFSDKDLVYCITSAFRALKKELEDLKVTVSYLGDGPGSW